ncbi:MAG: hypothetical protein PWQ79_397 [Thermococcaceae archaeon]|nr:hypothetical protein [Thermococcaceae archaeon]MDK2913482.1 hypothetical protein [Thermococcaceae archaeon]
MLNSLLEIFLLSLIPTFEGRYAVVYGIGRGYSLWETLFAATLGVLLLSLTLPLSLPWMDRIMMWLGSTSLKKIAHLYIHYVEHVRKKAHPYVKKWGFIGLTVFVAIPLPGTGVWTGALAAYIFGIEKRQTVPALVLGGILSISITMLPALGVFG